MRTDRNVPFFSMEEGAEISSPISPTALATKLPRNIEMLRDVLVTYTVFNFEIGELVERS